MTKDPVCGMTIDERTCTITVEYQGQRYYFCTQGCKDKFLAAPGKYSGTAKSPGQ